MNPLIAVIGGSAATPEEEAAAEAVGRLLAEAGAVLLCGGRGGAMEAACRGAKCASGLGEARNAVITRTAQAVIAIGGSYGTLSEIAFALRFGVPVVGLGTWEVKREGHPPAPVVYAATPDEAVERAVALARGRG
jgi:predicted Rossmann-fold nucleotide-binding protein